jgi:hypothetical protein
MTALFFELSRRSKSTSGLSTCGLPAMMLRWRAVLRSSQVPCSLWSCKAALRLWSRPIRIHESPPSLRRFHKPPESGCRSPAAPISDAQRKPDLGVISTWVEQTIFPARSTVAAKESLALAPTSASNDLLLAAADGFENKIRSVRNELTVYSENRTEFDCEMWSGGHGVQSQRWIFQ